MNTVNSMFFDSTKPDEVAGFNELLACLLKYNKENCEYYNDIHIKQEEFLIIMEWVQIPYDHEFGGKFEFVDYDQTVMTEKSLPDGTYVYVSSEDEYQELLDDYNNKQQKKSKRQTLLEND